MAICLHGQVNNLLHMCLRR